MKRREFIALIGGAAAGSPQLAAWAQRQDRVRHIGALMALEANDPDAQARANAFEQGLQQLGWAVGRNLHIEYRWLGSDVGRVQTYAAEIVGLRPDVILANTTPVLEALHKQTRTIPIVFVMIIDPVSRGFVSSLARPGGNITGFMNFDFPMGGKWVELLKQVAPGITSITAIFNPNTAPHGEAFFQQIKTSASSFGDEAIEARVFDVAELEKTIAEIATKPNGGLLIVPDIFTTTHKDLIAALALRHQLPGIYPFKYFASRGGLISYGVDAIETFSKAADYVSRILEGAHPKDLPVQAPTKFELVINLKTAKALGLDVPIHLQQLADEVIE